MANAGESEDPYASAIPQLDDNEIIYRKVPVSQNWVNAETGEVDANAFRPHRDNDIDGISMDRARSVNAPDFRLPQEAGSGASRRGYYVVALRISELRAHGIEVAPKPIPDNPGHVELPGLRADNRNGDDAKGIMDFLARHKCDTLGPFNDRE